MSPPSNQMGPPDSGNYFMLALAGDRLLVTCPIWQLRNSYMPDLSKDEALNLAAWIVSLADPTREKFERLLEEIQK